MTTTAKMPDRYMALLAQFRLRPIATEAVYESAMSVMEALMLRNDLADDEDEYADVLAGLIEDYEREHHPIRESSGIDVLRFLIEHSGRTQAQIAKEVGMAESTVSEILKGKRKLGLKHVEAFSSLFRVDPAAFLRVAETADARQE